MNIGQRYLLNTNILSALARNPSGPVAKQIIRVGQENVVTSLVVAAEIRFGLAKNSSRELRNRMESILTAIEVLPLEAGVDIHYGEIRWSLEKIGQPIGPNDLFIAAQARCLGLTLVTDNQDEFRRVEGLTVENWLG